MVVGICGSPRKAGNSEFLLNEALAVAGERGFETERLLLSELKADYCSDCGDCSKGRPCPKEDDMKGILSSLEKADGIIVASPVYFGGMTGQLKAVLDRTILLRRQNFRLKGKVGSAISVGGSRNGGQENTIIAINNFYNTHGITPANGALCTYAGACVWSRARRAAGPRWC